MPHRDIPAEEPQTLSQGIIDLIPEGILDLVQDVPPIVAPSGPLGPRSVTPAGTGEGVDLFAQLFGGPAVGGGRVPGLLGGAAQSLRDLFRSFNILNLLGIAAVVGLIFLIVKS